MIVFIGGIVFLTATLRYAISLIKKDSSSETEAAMAFFGNLLAIITFMIGLFHIDTIVTGFVNPEYGAIETIIDIVKQSK